MWWRVVPLLCTPPSCCCAAIVAKQEGRPQRQQPGRCIVSLFVRSQHTLHMRGHIEGALSAPQVCLLAVATVLAGALCAHSCCHFAAAILGGGRVLVRPPWGLCCAPPYPGQQRQYSCGLFGLAGWHGMPLGAHSESLPGCATGCTCSSKHSCMQPSARLVRLALLLAAAQQGVAVAVYGGPAVHVQPCSTATAAAAAAVMGLVA